MATVSYECWKKKYNSMQFVRKPVWSSQQLLSTNTVCAVWRSGWWTSWQAANNTANPQGTCIHSTLQCSSLTPFSNGLLRISAVTSWYSLNHGNSTEKPVCIPNVQQCNAKRITTCHDSAMLARVACTMNQVNVIYFRYRWRLEANKLSVWRILIHTEEKKSKVDNKWSYFQELLRRIILILSLCWRRPGMGAVCETKGACVRFNMIQQQTTMMWCSL